MTAPLRPWNWSWYTLRLSHYRLMRLRLQITCARGWEGKLAQRLRMDAITECGAGTFSCRIRRPGRIDVRQPLSVVHLIRRLGPGPALAAAVDEYEAAVGLCRRGQPVSPELTERLARACRRVMVLFPHPPHTDLKLE